MRVAPNSLNSGSESWACLRYTSLFLVGTAATKPSKYGMLFLLVGRTTSGARDHEDAASHGLRLVGTHTFAASRVPGKRLDAVLRRQRGNQREIRTSWGRNRRYSSNQASHSVTSASRSLSSV